MGQSYEIEGPTQYLPLNKHTIAHNSSPSSSANIIGSSVQPDGIHPDNSDIVRGGGNLVKRKRIRSIISKGRAYFFLIQETKLKEVSGSLSRSLWGCEDIYYSFSASDGFARGLLSIWKAQTVTVLASFRGSNYLGSKVSWKGGIFYIVNVYSPCSLPLKRQLWSRLLELKNNYQDGEWIFGGDFNVVKNRREIVGQYLRSSNVEWREFSDFIDDSDLVDVHCKGKKFRWFRGDGKSKSRIGQLIGSRDVYDHCPIWLLVNKEDWGLKPFKFNNEWFSDKSFFSFVEAEWKGIVVHGRGDFVLKEKFRIIKDRLRWWDKNIFGKVDLEVEEGVRVLNDSDDREIWEEEAHLNKIKASKEFG
ncbi:uncharacterized protein LOC131597359 [Vicia villosa]|uniref:uncharacterized protein LOC131597359 n=1 Tax=Vicia villosa TaxID=3911 RepID=UPI00273BBFB3|nr:uncharacterized protein LOC131597359 [Vicia villosa]